MPSVKSKRTKKRSKGRRPGLTRRSADRHLLYQWSVQNPEFEVELIEKICRKWRRPKPLLLREDFCGTAFSACHWVKSDPRRRAIGIDLDRPTLEWGKRHNVAPLGADAERVLLLEQDVRSVTTPRADVVAALNFSYYLFNEFAELVGYFRKVHASLKPGGLFFLDSYGGWESQQEKEEPREVEGPDDQTFTYIWDQSSYNPIDNMTRCYIHFEFEDGTRWNKAFTYFWRLYTPAEVRDALLEAGFQRVEVWWDREEDEDEDDDYRPARVAENTPGWIAYIGAEA